MVVKGDRTPEKRKVGGSTPPLTTRFRSICQPSHLRESQEERERYGAFCDGLGLL